MISGFLALTVLFLGLAAASPAFHHWLHKDSNLPSHECFITQIQRNQGLLSPAAVAFVAPLLSFRPALPFRKAVVLSQVRFQLPPGRGPP